MRLYTMVGIAGILVIAMTPGAHGGSDAGDCDLCGDILISEISDIPWDPDATGGRTKVIYGEDDRIDLYQETDPQRLDWAASTCALIQATRLTQQPDGSWIISSPGAYVRNGLPACEWEPFGDQPTAAYCSGFVVGEDLIATAGHCYSESSLAGVRFVFGFKMLDATTPRLEFLESEVYQGIEIVSRESSGALDHSVVRVDRPITAPNASALPVRRYSVVQPGTYVGVIGHPAGLPMKIAFGDTFVRSSTHNDYFVANLDTFGGNSGSPVFNAEAGVVEGILVRGATDYIFHPDCFESNVFDNDAGRGEDSTKTTVFADSIPTTEVMSIVECGDVYTDSGATASDQCYGDITADIQVVNNVNVDAVGVYAVTYNVSDADGNEADEALRFVYVEDTTPPELFLAEFDPGGYDVDGFLLHEYNESFSEPGAFLAYDVCEGDLGMPQPFISPGAVFAAAWLLDDEGQLQWVAFDEAQRSPDLRSYNDFMMELGDYLIGYIAVDSAENRYPELDEYGLPPVYDPLDGSSAFLDGEGNLKPEMDFVRLVRVVKTTPMEVHAVGETQLVRPRGGSVTFAVSVTNEVGPLAYQWYRVTDEKSYNAIPDAVESTYTIGKIQETDAGEYQCAVTDIGGDETVWSPLFTLSVENAIPAYGALGLALIALAAAVTGAVRAKKRR